jgi:hypothetical protein
MGEDDLMAEMVSRIEGGDTCVLAKDGVITACSKARGVKPLLHFLDNGKLDGAIVVDKIIGRAAAAICITGGAKEVHAKVMSEGARELLEQYGVAASGDEIVNEIANREKTGTCPMENAVKDMADPAEMVKAVEETLRELEAQ